jgi:hypothetical protein
VAFISALGHDDLAAQMLDLLTGFADLPYQCVKTCTCCFVHVSGDIFLNSV